MYRLLSEISHRSGSDMNSVGRRGFNFFCMVLGRNGGGEDIYIVIDVWGTLLDSRGVCRVIPSLSL